MLNSQTKLPKKLETVLNAFGKRGQKTHAYTLIWTIPLLQNDSGLVDGDLDFEYQVSLDRGCGLSLRGQMWYFGGGGTYSRQVSSKAIL